jgi:hypothetical protein
MRIVISCVTAALAFACTACSTNSGIYPVTGTVIHKGAPAAGATVFFYRQGADPMNEHMIMGIVQQDGTFDLACGSLGNGAPPGEYDVLVEWKQVIGQSKGRPQHGPDKLKGRYADRKQPRLHVTVEAKTNRLQPFDVTN